MDDQRMLVPVSEHGEHSVVSKGMGGTIGDRKVVKQFNKFQTLYDLRLEEQKDQDAVRYLVKKYLKIFRSIFNRYSNTIGKKDKSVN
jgi:hypothetical protein